MRIFGSDRISGLMLKLGMEEGQEIQHPLVTKSIETAQKRVEGRNFEIRKHLLEYDDVMNRQREIIYEERRTTLESPDLSAHVFDMIEDVLELVISGYLSPDIRPEDQDMDALFEALKNKFGISFDDLKKEVLDPEILYEDCLERIKKRYDDKYAELGKDLMLYLIRSVLLQILDAKWKEHLHNLDELQEGIHLRAYGQSDPLVEYKREAFQMFEDMTETVKEDAVEIIFKVQPVREERIETVLHTGRQELIHRESAGAGLAQPAPRAGQEPVSALPISQGVRPGREDDKAVPYRRDEAKVGRNDPCPCGSGRKYKKCCGA